MKKIIVLVFCIVCFSSYLWAGPFKPSPSVYAGGSFVTGFFPGGGLDGEEYYSAGSDFLLPVYKPSPIGFGWGISVGYQNSRGMGLELGVQQSYQSAVWSDTEGIWSGVTETELNTLLVYSVFFADIRQSFLINRRFQPFIKGGVGFNGITSKQGYLGVDFSEKGGFAGVGFRAGVGFDLYFTPFLSLAAAGMYQFDLFTSAEWSRGSGRIDPRITEHEIRAEIGIFYYYSLRKS